MNDPIDALRARRLEIADAIEALRNEDEELAITEQVLGRLTARPASADSLRGHVSLESASPSGATPQSQREMVLDALAAAPNPWMRTDEIIALAKGRWGVVMPARSLRPLLTVMKKARQIVRRGRTVALRQRASADAALAIERTPRIRRDPR